jgi:hypothetical protein
MEQQKMKKAQIDLATTEGDLVNVSLAISDITFTLMDWLFPPGKS